MNITGIPAEQTVYLRGIYQIEYHDGNLYFRHPTEPYILVTDLQGRFVQAIGGLGRGPGEFEPGVGAMAIRDDGLWTVNSAGMRTVSYFSRGEFVKSFRIKSIHVHPLAHNDHTFDFSDREVVLPCHPRTGYLAFAYRPNGTRLGIGDLLIDRSQMELLKRNPAINDSNWFYNGKRWYGLLKYLPVLLSFDQDFQTLGSLTLSSGFIDQKANEMATFEPNERFNFPVPLFSDAEITDQACWVLSFGYLHRFHLETGQLEAVYAFFGKGAGFPDHRHLNMHFFTIAPEGRVFLGNKNLPWGHDFWYVDLPRP